MPALPPQQVITMSFIPMRFNGYLQKEDNGKYGVYVTLDGTKFTKIGEVTDPKSITTNPFNLLPVDVGNYSDGTNAFVNYTPPTTAEEGEQRVVIDTGTPGGKRLYIRANGEWHYVTLS